MKDIVIKTYSRKDQKEVVDLWVECNLVVPWNDPIKDIDRKMEHSPEQFFVGTIDREIVSTCMAGYDGHRGWIYYLAVKPKYQRKGIGKVIVDHAEKILIEKGCPKINLMVRETNKAVISFYRRDGYKDDPVAVLSKRIVDDQKNQKCL